jgi:hypothetical protein
VVDGQEFNVVKKGYGQAKQIAEFGRWLNRHGAPVIQKLTGEDGGLEAPDTFQLVLALLDTLTPEAMIDLYCTVLGCERELANQHFEIDILVDALVALYHNQPAIQKVVSRFFSITVSEPTGDASSTPSAAPTDGATS